MDIDIEGGDSVGGGNPVIKDAASARTMICDQFGLGLIEVSVAPTSTGLGIATKAAPDGIPARNYEKIRRILRKGGIELSRATVRCEVLDGRCFSSVSELAIAAALIAAWHRTDIGGPFVFASELRANGDLTPIAPEVFDRIILELRAVQNLNDIPARIFIVESDSATALKNRTSALEYLPLYSIMGAETLADVVDEWMDMERLARALGSSDSRD